MCHGCIKVRLLQISRAQVSFVAWVVRFQFQRRTEFLNAAVCIADLQQRKPQIIVCVGTLGPYLHRLTKCGDRLFSVSRALHQQPQMFLRVGVAGIESCGALKFP